MREPGFYWVKRVDWDPEWFVANWRGDRWFSCGDECEFTDDALEDIDERRIVRCA